MEKYPFLLNTRDINEPKNCFNNVIKQKLHDSINDHMFLMHLFIKKFNYAFCLLNFPCIPAILKINSILSEHFIHIKIILFVNHIRKHKI